MKLNIQLFADGEVDIEVVLNTDGFDAQIANLEDKADTLAKEIEALSKVEPVDSEVLLKARSDYEKLGQQIDRLRKKQDALNNIGGLNFTSELKKSNNQLTGIIKKVGRWALALISIRSIYGLLSNAASQLDKTNQKTKANLDYIKSSLATAFEPVITKIVNLAFKLLDTINILVYKLTGKNLFKNARKNLESGAKSAKSINKSMAGFDEMNVISGSSSGAGGGGAGGKSFEWTNPEDAPTPKWMQWILDNGGTVAGLIGGISLALLGLKLGLDPIMALGIAFVGLGIGMLIDDIVKAIKDPSWENWGKVLADIAVIVGGIMLLFGNLWGLLVAGIALVVKLILDNWDTISAFLSKIGTWFYDNVIMPVYNFLQKGWSIVLAFIKSILSVAKGLFTTVYEIISLPIKEGVETGKKVFNSLKDAVKNIVDGIKKLFTGDLKGALDSFKKAFKNVFDALWTIAKSPINLIIGGINALIKGLNKIKFDVPDWIPGIGGKSWGFNLKEIPKLAKGGIINNPGHGVAIGGERGREGVIPLTDSQQMELLGEAIGKYITINANIINTMNGRVISRELQTINQQNNFAGNR